MAKQYRKINESKMFDEYDLEGSINGIIITLEEWKKKYGGDAHLTIGAHYNGDGIEIELTWTREETEKERATRLQQAKKCRDGKAQLVLANIAKEKLEYVRLKEKYG